MNYITDTSWAQLVETEPRLTDAGTLNRHRLS